MLIISQSPSPEGQSAAGRSTGLGEGEEGGESQVQADAGSLGSLDHVDEDVIATKSSKATGFLGKNSDITWMQRARTQLLESSPTSAKSATVEEVTAQTVNPVLGRSSSDLLFEISTYHLDDLNTSLIGDQVDPYGLPLRATADALTNSYFTTVHPAFPIILKPLFRKQYEKFFRSFFPPDSSKRWLAMLNLIFAIGAIHAHLTKAEWQGDDRDHLQYFTRARILAFDGGAGFEMPDLQQVQVIGLCACYLAANSQTNRFATLLRSSYYSYS
jgi:Fungal specific transcription factor domain